MLNLLMGALERGIYTASAQLLAFTWDTDK
jgi:hypothetical protein